jgi:(p)ppGpp synthase/HD superfamily hydrolase
LNFLKKKFNIYDNKIFDFIKYPKDNGYKSIHFKVEIIGYPVEIQIRTLEMDNNANYGVAAHFHYKQIPLVSQESKIKNYLKKKYKLSKQENDSGYKDFIFVFTATNEKISIPKKSTLFDFAFTLHTSFAEKFNYALVNNKKVTDKGYRLKNADKIKIIRDNKITIEEKDIDFLFNKKNKKLFNSLLNKINKNI